MSSASSDPYAPLLAFVRARWESKSEEEKKAWEARSQLALDPPNKPDPSVSLSDRVAIVTGGNGGIGLETGRALALRGAKVVLACRSAQRGQEAAKDIEGSLAAAGSSGSVSVMVLDVGSLESVRQFAQTFRERHDRLDILVNNAGIMAVPFQRSNEGFESQLAVNHLGHFLLTNLLWDLLSQAPDARVVNVSSMAHANVTKGLESLNQEEGYEPWTQYALTKMCNIWFTFALARRCEQAGLKNVTVSTLHPGFVRTSLQEKINLDVDAYAEASHTPPLTPAQGALTSIYVAMQPGIPSGKYWDISQVSTPLHRFAVDEAMQESLWQMSEKWCSVQWNF